VNEYIIDAVSTLIIIFVIDTAFGFETGKGEVTILAVPCEICINRIYDVPYLKYVKVGHLFHQIQPLIKKRPIRIIVTAVLQRIPFVRIPTIAAVHMRIRSWRIHGKQRFTAHLALATVKDVVHCDRRAAAVVSVQNTAWVPAPAKEKEFFCLLNGRRKICYIHNIAA